MAAETGQLKMVRLLLEHGARPDLMERTAVLAASETGQDECLKLLLGSLTVPGAIAEFFYHQEIEHTHAHTHIRAS